MTVLDITLQLDFEMPCKGQTDKPVTGVYCCDLLSIVMGRAQSGNIWVTVMGNVNAVAVALLADISCIVLAEGAALDPQAGIRAAEQGITVLRTPLPIFEAALKIQSLL